MMKSIVAAALMGILLGSINAKAVENQSGTTLSEVLNTDVAEAGQINRNVEGEWVATPEGDRYKVGEDCFVTDDVIYIDDVLYYSIQDGYWDKTPNWKHVNGEWYKLDENGNVMHSCWAGCYYLLEDGKMAYNQYIDRFYVGENGEWKNNSWETENWKIDGDWIKRDGIWYFRCDDGKEQIIDLSQMRSIARLGYDVRSSETPPEQSIASYQLALGKGLEILLCDLRYTKDNVAVCFHDENIDAIARKSDGSLLVELGENKN